MAGVYAGFSEYTDAQVGRIIDYLEQTGQLENTIVFYCADIVGQILDEVDRDGIRLQVCWSAVAICARRRATSTR